MPKFNSSVKVKICGMTRPQDVQSAIELGVDGIGMILHANSPRLISCQRACEIRTMVPDSIPLIGVFVDAAADFINQLVSKIGLDAVQLHGHENDVFASQLNVPYIKAIRVKDKPQLETDLTKYSSACAILLDPYVAGRAGGTGKILDIDFWPDEPRQKMILAGGLNASNLAATLKQISPYAVDLNSGVESEPGIKSPQLIAAALQALGR